MRTSSSWMLVLALPLLVMAACGGGGEPTVVSKTKATVKVEEPPPPAETGPDAPEDTRPGSVKGKVVFVGTPPVRQPLNFGGKKECDHGGATPLSEKLIVNSGRIENCIVAITKGLPRGYEAPPVPDHVVEFDQRGCVYIPHVAALRAGQTALFKNSDPGSHNVHIYSKYTPTNKTQAPGVATEHVFAKKEYPVTMGCDIHPWMRAYVGVFDNPFFAVTGPDGSFEIKGLPPGSYVLTCWQEKLGKQKVKFDLPPGAVAEVEFEFQ